MAPRMIALIALLVVLAAGSTALAGAQVAGSAGGPAPDCEPENLLETGIATLAPGEVLVHGRFTPSCVEVTSGETVAWTVIDGVRHDPGSLNDGGDCFRPATDTPGAQPLAPGDRYAVTFTWDGGATVGVEVTLNGEEIASRACSADKVADPGRSTTDHLVVPYLCYRHPSTIGTIVLASGAGATAPVP